MTVAAVVPHWNRSDLLRSLLENLRLQSRPFDEVIVADNGSTDNSAQTAEQAGARVVRLGRNLGFAAAVNRGIAAANTDWIAVLNNDVTLDTRWLAQLLAAVETSGAWFAAGKILSANEPSIIDGAFDEISSGACACRCGAGKPDGPFWNEPRRIRIAPMTAALFRRKLFEEIGLLDETFQSYLEDVDFGLRCALGRREGIYVPGAVAHHSGSATSGKWNKDTVRLIARNQVLLAAKYFRGQPRWPIVAGQLLWGLVAFRHGRGWAYVRGKWAGLRAMGCVQAAPFGPEAVGAIVGQSERQILEVQHQTGFDRYWRAYFWLRPR